MPSAATARIFAQLPGRWSLERDIADTGRFSGLATFTPFGNGSLLYEENGETHFLTGQRVEGFRRFEYRPGASGIDVYFRDEGRRDTLYVMLFFQDNTASATHLCGADRYEHTMTWNGPDNFETRVSINGPRKDLHIRSLFSRKS